MAIAIATCDVNRGLLYFRATAPPKKVHLCSQCFHLAFEKRAMDPEIAAAVEKAKLSEQAERYDDMAKVKRFLYP